MSALPNKIPTKRRLLLASDRSDQSSELAHILRAVGQVDTIATSAIPEAPSRDLSGIGARRTWLGRVTVRCIAQCSPGLGSCHSPCSPSRRSVAHIATEPRVLNVPISNGAVVSEVPHVLRSTAHEPLADWSRCWHRRAG